MTTSPSPVPKPVPATVPGLSKTRLALVFSIAAASDALSAFFTLAPPILWAIDGATALLLFVALGWRWMLLPGLIAEAIPGISVFPSWLLVVAALTGWQMTHPNLPGNSA
jgi:hypothetical protein